MSTYYAPDMNHLLTLLVTNLPTGSARHNYSRRHSEVVSDLYPYVISYGNTTSQIKYDKTVSLNVKYHA